MLWSFLFVNRSGKFGTSPENSSIAPEYVAISTENAANFTDNSSILHKTRQSISQN